MSVEWRGTVVAAAATTASSAALFAGADLIRGVAIQNTPKDSGDLRQSITAEAEGTQAVVYSDSVYAARQHEEVGWHHEVGQAKFLEAAVNSQGAAAMQLVAAKLRGAIGG